MRETMPVEVETKPAENTAIAENDGETAETGPSETYIICELAGATYGIPSRDIAHLEMVGTITPVPNAPESVEGVVSTRGQVIPVVNLRARFGFPRVPADLRSRLVIVRSGPRAVGLMVDGAREFATIPTDSIKPPPEDIAEISGDYLEGLAEIGDRLVLILRTKRLLEIEVAPESIILPPAAAEDSEDRSDR